MKKGIYIIYYLGILLFLNSCSNKYYTMEDFKKIRKIDTHTHIESKNFALVEQAKEDNFTLVSINTDIQDYPSLKEQYDDAMTMKTKYPENFAFITAFSLSGWESANWTENTIAKLKSDFANGALGVKVWKNIGMSAKDSAGNYIRIDDPKFDAVTKFIAQQDKMVLGHLGEPKNCWLPLDQMTVKNDKKYFTEHPEFHMFLHPELPTYEDQIDARDKFLERNPNLRFVGAHLGSIEWSVDELARHLDKFPNMAVDMADRICHLQFQSQKDREKVRQFFIKYQDRIMYATDAGFDFPEDDNAAKSRLHDTWLEDWKYFVTDQKMTVSRVDGEFEGLKLPKEIIDKIYYKNAVRWFKMK